MATKGHNTLRAAWENVLAAYEAAKAEDTAFNAIFDPIYEQREQEVEAIPVKPLPVDNYVGRSASEFEEGRRAYWGRVSARVVADWDAGKVHVEPFLRDQYERHVALCREVVAIEDEYRAAVKVIEDRLGFEGLLEKYEALGEAVSDAETAVMATPAPDSAALLWKLERLLFVEGDGSTASWSGEYVAQTRSDMRLLMDGEA